MYRTNTFPLIHTDVLHLIVNLLAVTPMLERFEAEYGTLTSVALFMGRECCRDVVASVSDEGG